MADVNKELSDKVDKLTKENAALKQQLEAYQLLINKTIDDIHENETENDEKTKVKITYQIDWKRIKKAFAEEDDEYIMQLISDDMINFSEDHDESGDNIWTLATQYGRLNVLKLCVNLGLDINNVQSKNGFDALHIARTWDQDETLEWLLLEKVGAGKANDIVKACDKMWEEDGVLNAFLEQLNDDKFKNVKAQIVEMIGNIIKNRDPISSFLINLSMSLDSIETWKCVKKIMDEIINDPKDSIGWYYLNNYLVKNNTFLFRKYQLQSNESNKNDDQKTEDTKRRIDELNELELIYFLDNICIVEYNKKAEIKLSESDCTLIARTIKGEGINGSKFCQNYNEMMKIFSFLQSGGINFEVGWPFATYLFEGYFVDTALNKVYEIPIIIENEYGFDQICEDAEVQSAFHAKKDIKATFENEEKTNKENWQFIKEYGTKFVSKYGDKRLRQDLLDKGVKSKYSRDEMIKYSRKSSSFNALRFYDCEIYLNQLMLQCAFMNHQFQKDVQSIFEDNKDCIFRPGPLKKTERCKVKTETDYMDEEWPQSSCLLDIIRCTVTFKSIESMINGIKVFEDKMKDKILRIKNGFIEYQHSNPEYVDVKFNVCVAADGRECIGEVQFLLADMSRFKLKAHKFYGIVRQKEYFENLKLVRTIKHNLDKKLLVCAQKGDAKGIKNIFIKERIKNLSDLKKLSRLENCLWSGYHYGHVKVLKSFISLFNDDKKSLFEFLKIRVSDFGGTGLMLSSFHGRYEMAKYILSLLKDSHKDLVTLIFDRNNLGRNPFLCACSQGQVENAKLLLSQLNEKERFDLIQTKNKKFESCIIEAAKNGHVDIMSFVLSQLNLREDKLKILMQESDEYLNAFAIACANGQSKAAKFILMELDDKEKAKKLIADTSKLIKLKTIKVSASIELNIEQWEKEFC